MADTKAEATTTTETKQPKRYAAYNVTLAKFIGGVKGTKKAVDEQPEVQAADDAGHETEVREV